MYDGMEMYEKEVWSFVEIKVVWTSEVRRHTHTLVFLEVSYKLAPPTPFIFLLKLYSQLMITSFRPFLHPIHHVKMQNAKV